MICSLALGPHPQREPTAAQAGNLQAIVDALKRTYNVVENRVALSGVSDGGTAAYYMAMRDTTPYARFLPLNGFLMVPDAVDFARPVTVVADGRTVFAGRVERSVATLMKWAARDNDRTMVYGAEVSIGLTR